MSATYRFYCENLVSFHPFLSKVSAIEMYPLWGGFTVLLCATYSKFIEGVWLLFMFHPHLYIRELPMKCPREKNLDQWKIPTRKNFGPTKYPREKNLDPQNTQGEKFRTQDGTIVRDPRHPRLIYSYSIFKWYLVYSFRTYVPSLYQKVSLYPFWKKACKAGTYLGP